LAKAAGAPQLATRVTAELMRFIHHHQEETQRNVVVLDPGMRLERRLDPTYINNCDALRKNHPEGASLVTNRWSGSFLDLVGFSGSYFGFAPVQDPKHAAALSALKLGLFGVEAEMAYYIRQPGHGGAPSMLDAGVKKHGVKRLPNGEINQLLGLSGSYIVRYVIERPLSVHLLGIAAEAAGSACASHPEATGIAVLAAASSLPGQLCALCGGGCCTRGDKHAYLNAPTLRLFMDAHPHLSADEVMAAYLDRVATRTQSGSCINHTRQGCCLRREMRSDTCNRFACESLARLQAAQREAQPVQMILVVRRKQDQWRRTDPGLDNAINGGAVLCEAGTRRIRKGMQGQACAIDHALSNGHSKTLQECTRPPILVEHRAAARAGVEPCQIKYRWAR
jgi:hypothetical protein